WSGPSRSACGGPSSWASGGEEVRELLQRGIDLRDEILRQLLLRPDAVEDTGVLGLEEGVELAFVALDGVHGNRIEVAIHRRVDDGDLLLDRQRRVLALLHHLDQTVATAGLVLGGGGG